MLACGVDFIAIERIEAARERFGVRFLDRIFTPAEQAHCAGRPHSLAVRWAAKEAVGKALGVGVRFTWKEIEIVGRPKPGVRLSGRTRGAWERLGSGEIDLSMTHSRELAAAICILSP